MRFVRAPLAIVLALGVLLLSPCVLPHAQAKLFKRRPKEPAVPYTNVEQMAGYFVELIPNNPVLYPNNLDLFHIESTRRVMGAAILSPDKRLMATTEVLFLPETLETTSRVWVGNIGRPPVAQEYLKAEALAKVDTYVSRPSKKTLPHVTIFDINPVGFYKQFQFDAQMASARELLKTDVASSKPHDARIYQLVDWSRAGESLLLSYRDKWPAWL